MPKKPSNKRLDRLFEDIKEEAALPPRKSSKKKVTGALKEVRPGPARSTQPVEVTPAPAPKPRTLARTAVLPSLTPVTVLQPGSAQAPASMSLAFQTGDKNWATLQVVDETARRDWGTNEQLLVRQVADQLSLALENAHLFQETRSRAEELAVLNELAQRLASRLDVDQVMQEIYRGLGRLMDVRNFYIGLYNPDKNEVVFPLNASESVIDQEISVIRADEGITGHIIRTRAPFLVKENLAAELLKIGVEPVGDMAESWLGVPLMQGDQVLGVMGVQSYTESNRYDEHDRDLMMAFAGQAAIAIQNARLFDEIQRRNEQLATLNEIVTTASQSLDLKSILTNVLEKLFAALGFDAGMITIFNEKRGKLERAVRIGMPGEEPEDPAEGLDGSLCDLTFQTSRIYAISDLGRDAPVDVGPLLANGIKSYLGVPLKAKGATIGTLCIFRRVSGDIPESSVTLAQSIGNQIGFAIENARLFQETQRRAEIETFTGEISAAFVGIDPLEVDARIQEALRRLGEFIKVDRAYLFLFSEDSRTMSNTHEWCGPGVTSHINDLRNVPVDTFPYLMKSLRRFESFYVPRVADLPKEGAAEKQEFERESIKSIVCTPLGARESLIGFIGFDVVRNERVWSEDELNLLGLVGGLFVTALNRKQTAEALRKSEADLRSLFASMEDVVLVYDKDGRYVRIAPTNPARLIRPPSELLGKLVDQVLPAEMAAYFKDAIRKTLATGQTTQIEYELPIEGQRFWFLANLTRLDNDHVFWVARDITERKKAEESLHRRNEYLAASAEIGRLVTSTLDLNTLFSRTVNLVRERFGFYHAAIFIVEETGFNAVLQEATGEAGAQMKAQKHGLTVGSKSVIGEVTQSGKALIVNDTAASPVHKMNPLLPDTRAEAGIPLRIGNRIIGALDIQSKDTNAFKEDDIAVLQTLADQIAIAIDNARSYELSLQAVKEMREIDRIKSQFLANMSHELRTPLNSIIGFSRVILKGIDGPITDLQQQDLLAIHNSGQHLLGLINDILDLSRIEAGKMELSFDEVNMRDLINSVMSTITGLVKDKPIKLERSVPDDLPTVRADTMRVRQVLINLLSNAAKFTDEGTVTVKAEVQQGPAGHPELLVSVIDTGSGIAPEDQGKLFQPFSQVDASSTRKTGGSGLGLSISHQLIQMHGGRIGVQSAPGQGSTFYFTLPLYRGRDDASTLQASRVILAIDDDPQVIGLYERYLQPQGYQVIALSDPAKARERAAQLRPFAITLDIMMPGYDGWQVLQDLKSDSETRDIPVVICSIVEEREKGFSL
ncbi:MAG: GAF domain-containing protein, partial [Chloroflexota bacterium]